MPVLARRLAFILLLVAPASLAAQTFPPGAAPLPSWGSPVAGAEPIRSGADAGGVTAASFTSSASQPPGLEKPEASTAPAGSPQDAALSPITKSDLPRLSPPGRPAEKERRAGSRTGLLPSFLTIGSSLAVVLGIFFLLAWVMRRATPGTAGLLSSEVVEVLGRSPLTHRQQLHLLRCGRKLLLVNVCAEGVETLTEITDPEEVDRLLGLCRQSHPQSASAAFRQIFQQFTGERTGSSRLDRVTDEPIRFAGFGRSDARLEDGDV